MRPRVAIPLPHGGDPEYALRAIPQYERAIELSGGEAVRIPLDRTPAEVMKLIERSDAVVLPGSKADVDPAKFDAPRHPKTEPADALRDTVDELLLQDAYNMQKPVLGICYGLQILNVYRSGNLLQHIESPVNHEAGRKVPVAHKVAIDAGSRLYRIVAEAQDHADSGRFESTLPGLRKTAAGKTRASAPAGPLLIPANSSHHQAAGDVIGDGLKVVARCPDDNIIEALEGTSPEHFVLAVQWHPERSFDEDPLSQAIFSALVEAAQQKHKELVGEFEASDKF